MTTKTKNALNTLFQSNLKRAVKEGFDNTEINRLVGCTEKKLVLTEAEGQAGKYTYAEFMTNKRWNEEAYNGGWLFGSTDNELCIGLVPDSLADNRLGLNRHCWNEYQPIT